MRRLIASVLGVAFVSALLVVLPVGDQPANADPRGPAITWRYEEDANAYWRTPDNGSPGGPSGPATVLYEWSLDPARVDCKERNDPDFACYFHVGGEDCYDCETVDDEGNVIRVGVISITCGGTPRTGENGLPIHAMIRYEREIEPDGTPGKWWGADAECQEPPEDDVVPMEEITAGVEYELEQRVGTPEISIAPEENTLVNLPTILSTTYPAGIDTDEVVDLISLEDPTRIRVNIHIDRPGGGLDGEIIADAAFKWSWDGGSATGRGRPYEFGITPRSRPGYYTTAAFGTTGEHTIDVQVEWTGEVTVDTLDPEPILPVFADGSSTVTAVESRGVLTGR